MQRKVKQHFFFVVIDEIRNKDEVNFTYEEKFCGHMRLENTIEIIKAGNMR